MHIAVLLQHYHTPDCATAARPWSLVKTLADEHDVTFITTDAWEARRLTHRFDWCPEPVSLRTLHVPYANEMGAGRRLRAYLAYAARAAVRGVRMPRPDLIYASSTPLTVGMVGAALAARWRCPWIFEVRDLWPDFPIQMGALPNPLLRRALYLLERGLYRHAAAVITASPDMTAHVRQFVPPARVATVPYGTDLALLNRAEGAAVHRLRRRLQPERRRLVLYAGSLGRASDIPTLARVARRFRARRDVQFVFAGRGYYHPFLKRVAADLPNVSLLDPLPYPEALALFALADLSLVPFIDRPVLSANAPSKFFDSLTAGTPAIVTNPGWTKRFVETHRCGWYVPPEQPEALARRIETVLHDEQGRRQAACRAQTAGRAHFDRAVHMKKILSIIDHVATQGP